MTVNQDDDMVPLKPVELAKEDGTHAYAHILTHTHIHSHIHTYTHDTYNLSGSITMYNYQMTC